MSEEAAKAVDELIGALGGTSKALEAKRLTWEEREDRRAELEDERWVQLRDEEAARHGTHVADCAARAAHYADWKQIASAEVAAMERIAIALEDLVAAKG